MRIIGMTLSIVFAVVIFVSGCTPHVPAPVSNYGEREGAGSAGAHTVKSGDTLYSIARRYKLNFKDLAAENDLYPPYKLDVGQRLKLPPPETYRVRAGDSISSIARLFATDTMRIAQVNNLPKPYKIYPGQVLKLPRVTVAEVMAQQAAEEQELVQAVQQPKRKPSFEQSNKNNQQASSAQKNKTSMKKPVSTNPPKKSSNSKFFKPVQGKKISSFGVKKGGFKNDGVNITAPKGSPVKAAENGVVVYAGNELRGSGNLILVRHESRYMTAYAHLDEFLIRRGQIVKRGQPIGTVGSTGSVSSPQLHFEVRKGTKALDPEKYINGF